jgi:hypothetical protein
MLCGFLAYICNNSSFLWYSEGAGEGLRSVGVEVLPPSKSICSILPTARRLRAESRTRLPARCVVLRRFSLLGVLARLDNGVAPICYVCYDKAIVLRMCIYEGGEAGAHAILSMHSGTQTVGRVLVD